MPTKSEEHKDILGAAKGILFDMDGVLLDTEPLYTVAYDHLLKPFGHRLDRDTKLEIMGRKALDSAAHVIAKFSIPLSAEDFLEKRKPILLELFGEAPEMEGAQDLVQALKLRGVRLAVATSSSRDILKLKTQRHAWFENFDAIVCGDDRAVVNPKPAPDIFIAAANQLGLEPSACCAFEDSPSGAVAACASGARTFAVVPEPTERPRFPKECLFVRSLSDLL